MKILLVNPYIYDFTAYDLWLRPLGLLYVAAVLKKYTDAELYWLDALDRFQEGAFPAGDKTAKKARADGRGKYHREVVKKPAIFVVFFPGSRHGGFCRAAKIRGTFHAG